VLLQHQRKSTTDHQLAYLQHFRIGRHVAGAHHRPPHSPCCAWDKQAILQQLVLHNESRSCKGWDDTCPPNTSSRAAKHCQASARNSASIHCAPTATGQTARKARMQ